MGKPSAPEPPNYEPLARASEEQSQRAFDLSEETLAWNKEQYAMMQPYTIAFLDAQTRAAEQNQRFAEEQLQRYRSEYAPIEEQFAQRALEYNTPERAAQESAASMKDIDTEIEATRQASMSNLASYGIDASELKMSALDLNLSVLKALAKAGARTDARRRVAAQADALQLEAIKVGQGYPTDVAKTYATLSNTGSGLNTANKMYATGAEAMGTPVQGGAQGFTGIGSALAVNNAEFDAAHKNYATKMTGYNSMVGGLGNMIGGALAFGLSPPGPTRMFGGGAQPYTGGLY